MNHALVNVSGGSGGNVFNVQSTPANVFTHLETGSGNDTVNVGNTANTLDGIQGTLSVTYLRRPGEVRCP